MFSICPLYARRVTRIGWCLMNYFDLVNLKWKLVHLTRPWLWHDSSRDMLHTMHIHFQSYTRTCKNNLKHLDLKTCVFDKTNWSYIFSVSWTLFIFIYEFIKCGLKMIWCGFPKGVLWWGEHPGQGSQSSVNGISLWCWKPKVNLPLNSIRSTVFFWLRKLHFVWAMRSVKMLTSYMACLRQEGLCLMADNAGLSLWPKPALFPKIVNPQTVKEMIMISWRPSKTLREVIIHFLPLYPVHDGR